MSCNPLCSALYSVALYAADASKSDVELVAMTNTTHVITCHATNPLCSALYSVALYSVTLYAADASKSDEELVAMTNTTHVMQSCQPSVHCIFCCRCQ
jgi:hypothetical protein